MGEGSSAKFTFVHLIVVVFCILFLGTLLLPSIGRPRGPANRIKCSSNLRQIGLAMKMYANGETRTNAFPRTRYDRATADKPNFFTRPAATQPFADDGPLPNDVTAALFLTLRTQELTTDVFLCPSDSKIDRLPIPDGKTIQSFSNFPSSANLSYSMQNPYPTEAAEKAGFRWDDGMNADFAIMADMNPGTPEVVTLKFTESGAEQRKANSRNNQQDGQNVLYADGHVDWSASVWAGAQQDNIYAFAKLPNGPRPDPASTTQPTPAVPPAAAGIVGPPADALDSVMLPTADTKPTAN